ncbi:N-acetyl-gamma-glutamyl-phosphate reductase [Parasphingopyxis sp. CP4]|uniref:N-acetyl-gamma-glutamyl-phosphate reductase n=1 Tax=Parasphingopyxis sp. CP4 TaxID=2724527 RepID=UPI0015A42A95|nr:N-acetyl-gamma-glutamyl-phosphate reductase [Parasphingopyxis sp. CP4]QLC21199.1 N-acetyl-gamma-glutamyl-phosphate reductase [Parasphingopyxis sp. CP4]
MTVSVFIDGGHGTTGLQIRERLADRSEISLLLLDDAQRKDAAARRDALHSADIAILCLPDDAAREAVALLEGSNTRVIDASTAHRTALDWTFGFPEWEPGHGDTIATSHYVANPGCYAQTFIALTHPLIQAGILDRDANVTVNATSGYSGGGKAMIAEFEGDEPATAFRNYALTLAHKHLPEMQRHSGLASQPLFSPSVANIYSGMLVEIPLPPAALRAGTTEDEIRSVLTEHYAVGQSISVLNASETAALDVVTIERCAGTDRMEIIVFANPQAGYFRLCAVLDNLGKGAAGAAVQNLNLMAGLGEFSGLRT